MPKVSVIVPVYKVEQHLRECLTSVISQTFQDWELICIDDGSPDECGRILEEFAANDIRIKLIAQKNLGLSVARNTGLKNATGDYVMFLDSDDKLLKYSLEYMYTIAEESKTPVVVSTRFFNKGCENKSYNYSVHRRNILKSFVNNKYIYSSVCNKIYRRDILDGMKFIPGINFEDWPFLTELFGKIDSYAITNTPCYIYNKSNVSITRSKFTQYKVNSYIKGIRSTYDLYKDRKDLRTAQKRMAVATKMMINKVYNSKNKELQHYTKIEFNNLLREGLIHIFDLPFKTIIRIWRMK